MRSKDDLWICLIREEKRSRPGHHFINHAPKRIGVAGRTYPLARSLLGREIEWRAKGQLVILVRRRPSRLSDAEVDQLDRHRFRKEDIRRLDIEMTQPAAMQVIER